MKQKRRHFAMSSAQDKTDIYLAGSMTGRKVSQVLFERAEAKALLSAYGLTWYDPADGEGLEEMAGDAIISNAFDLPKMKKFVSKDLAAVANSRAVLNINGDMGSEGALWEMAFAVFHRFIPVHIVAPLRVSMSKMTFTNVLVDGLHENLQSAVFAISEKLKETNPNAIS
jgi:hypothetical protein